MHERDTPARQELQSVEQGGGAEDITRDAPAALSADQVRQVGLLARLQLNEEEVARLTGDLNVLLAHFRKLGELETDGVPPTSHVLDLVNVGRDDVVAPSLPIEDVLANAPESEGRFFVVPRIVDSG
jgi:aspartyl-tRNA(Asn)/glutamyl-tRNA(Gln) amidotransferase subunit C